MRISNCGKEFMPMNARYDAPLAVAESVFDDLVAIERDGGGEYEWDLSVAPIVAEFYDRATLDECNIRAFGNAIVNVIKDIQRENAQRDTRSCRTENVLFIAGVIATIAHHAKWTLKLT